MTGLMAIFLVIGVIGLLFLLVSLVVGDVFEALGFDFGLDASHDFGVFDSRVIAVFLTAFGGFGAIGATLGNGALGGSLFGLLGGAAFGAIVFYSLKHVGKNLAISLQEFITLSFLYRKRTIKRILFAFIFQTSALP
ncbi:MAG TPA: hypothetical protein VNI84_04590, partial [Pyrinomonadaceae bacterium]|nr:hypothetical protein [Pyrinomonadaceae bacterium]